MGKKETKIILPDFMGKNDASIHDKNQELREILSMTSSARKKLENLILRCEEADEDVSELDEAVDALSDAAEIMEEALGDLADDE